jgi:SAM-dependent methyltransferase
MINETQQKVHDWYSSHHDNPSGESYLDAKVIGHLINKTHSVLNLGCYRGDLERILSHKSKRWLGIDFVKDLIEYCWKLNLQSHVTFLEHNITNMVFVPSNHFDVVLDMSTGDHLILEDFKKMLLEVYRVLIPDGQFAIAFYNLTQAGGSRTGDDNYGYYRKDTPTEMEKMLKNIGFDYVSGQYDSVRSYIIVRKPYV